MNLKICLLKVVNIFSFLNELPRSKVKKWKNVKTHLDQIRPTSREDAPAGASSSRGNDAVEVNSRYGGSYSVFLSFRAHSIALEERLPQSKLKNGRKKKGTALIPFFSLSVQTQ